MGTEIRNILALHIWRGQCNRLEITTHLIKKSQIRSGNVCTDKCVICTENILCYRVNISPSALSSIYAAVGLSSSASSKEVSFEPGPWWLIAHTFSVFTKLHRLDLGPLLTGIALSSVRIHKYSPSTAVRAMQATLTSHQDRAAGG